MVKYTYLTCATVTAVVGTPLCRAHVYALNSLAPYLGPQLQNNVTPALLPTTCYQHEHHTYREFVVCLSQIFFKISQQKNCSDIHADKHAHIRLKVLIIHSNYC